jgi:hypothetical protein
MNISEKLDFLMNLTNTKNVALGKALSFDPSYISRIRSGSRGTPKNQSFSKEVAAYFSRNIKDVYQIEAVSKMIFGADALPIDKDELESSLYKWLEQGPDVSTQAPVVNLISDITNMLDGGSMPGGDISFDESAITPASDDKIVPVYAAYGNQGKRESVKRFLMTLVMKKKPFKLFLYSDEDMSWLYESPEFSRQWGMLLFQLLKNGSRIQIIHTISRDLVEMMEAIRKWMPLYSTGAIEPYYYPKLRDGVYRRSLFIAQGHSALVSTSVENKTEDMVNLLIRNTEVVSALEKEYSNYFELCRPLMKMFSVKNRDAFMDLLLNEDVSGGKFYMSSPLPSIWTMPEALVKKLAEKAGDPSIIKVASQMRKNMISLLEGGGRITEIISGRMESLDFKSGAAMPLSDMIGSAEYVYFADDYIEHLKETERLCEKYAGYSVIISDSIPATLLVMSHSESDTIIAGASVPTAAFCIAHRQFSFAFYEYMERIEKDSERRKAGNTLSDYLKRLLQKR